LAHYIASDGVQIAYGDEGVGRPLVFLHGLMADRRFFDKQRELADRFRVIAIDLRGHGESRAENGLSIEQLADDVAGIADRLKLEDAIGIGWSLGAAVLWEVLAGPASNRFAGAVVVDMTPKVTNDHGWELGLSTEACEARSLAMESDFPTFATGAGQAIFRPTSTATDEAARWAGERFAANDAASIASLWRSLMQRDYRAALARIEQPTLIIHGAHSHLYGPETAEHLGRAIPDSRIVRFEESGHSPHLEQPELFNDQIAKFAGQLPQLRLAPTRQAAS
jgi:pimeloyl-ACP methyl ester carboxylesterase